MNYESWRITFQSSEQAAFSAFNTTIQLRQQLAAAIAACEVKDAALQEVVDLIGESSGVYGLHLNGDNAPWEEVEQGGRFERLTSLCEALAVKQDATALNAHDEALIERCAAVCRNEYVDALDSGCAEDFAYNNALEHASDAIRNLKGK